ncbi:MAG TPA: ROK family protein [Bacteroides sp.]|nr:ROK family protein [Bacteroides sp.]
MTKVVAGIDIGGTFTKIGIVDQAGKVYADDSIALDAQSSIEKYLKDLEASVRRLFDESGENMEFAGIGIGAPMGNYYSGTIEHAPNLNWGEVIPMVNMIEDRFSVPTAITNDANAAALGEMMYGSAVDMKDFIVITLGTGLGSGIVVNGNVVYGHDGLAGELGHVNVQPDGRHCNCGLRGCLETYVSATGIKRTVFELLARRNDPSELRDIPFGELTAKNISEAAERGDLIASKAFGRTGRTLGRSLANVVALLGPKAIFLLGGLANAGDLLFKPVQENLEINLLYNYKGKVEILPSGLSKGNTAVLGAAGLAWKEVLG